MEHTANDTLDFHETTEESLKQGSFAVAPGWEVPLSALAVISGIIVILFYVVTLFCRFFSPTVLPQPISMSMPLPLRSGCAFWTENGSPRHWLPGRARSSVVFARRGRLTTVPIFLLGSSFMILQAVGKHHPG